MLPKYFEDLKTLHVNNLKRKNYYIPFDSDVDILTNPTREESRRFISLNGEWDFHYFESVHDIEEPYWKENCDLPYDQLPVPGCWQLHGYGQIMYSNTEYPIPFDPPYVPFENPAGLYRKVISLETKDKSDYQLVFEGVDSAFYVWVNGEFVGYSQVSHAYHEFDVTKYLVDGDNLLHVLVLQWSDGTYLEDQDKFRYSGIFRDVYVLERARDRVEAFQVHQHFNDDLSLVNLSIDLEKTNQNLDVIFHLYDPSGHILAKGKTQESQVDLQLANPILWNAEQPNLYHLLIKTEEELISQKVGIRKVEMRDNLFWVNNKPVKLVGVNHHDTHPNTGASVTHSDQLNDLKLIKAANFNALRTAHYPKNGPFYELTDQLGLYVISEADLEGHGVVDLYGMGGNANYNRLPEDPTFKSSFVDRMDASIVPFRNFSSIIMWSAGNETGYGDNVEAMLRHARKLDPTRPLHYEAYWYYDRNKTYDTSVFDSWSRMYASPTEIKELYLQEGKIEKAFMLCEYAHAMGNSSGDLTEYYELFVNYPEFIGLFVWEWADHAVNINRHDLSQEPVYRYGGDFGDYPNAGNFCMDGLVYPDRTPHVLLKEHANLFSPVRVVDYDVREGKVTLKNYLDFTNSQDWLDALVESYDLDGNRIAEVKLPLLDIEPQDRLEVDLAGYLANEKLSGVRIVYFNKAGEVNSFDWLEFSGANGERFVDLEYSDESAIQVAETNRHVILSRKDEVIRLSKASAAIDSWVKDEQELLKDAAFWNIWRAPTDNDRNIKREWLSANYDKASVRVHNTKVEKNDQTIKVIFEGVLNAPARQNILEFSLSWIFDTKGVLAIKGQVETNPVMPYLPRFGLSMQLSDTMDRVQYYGLGPHENYRDKTHSVYPAYFNLSVSEFYEPYVTPQENGNRSSVKYFAIKNLVNRLQVWTEEELNFSVHHYSTEQLTQTMHRDELVAEPYTYLNIDPIQSGIGTNACGPELFDHYRLQGNFDFEWKMYVE